MKGLHIPQLIFEDSKGSRYQGLKKLLMDVFNSCNRIMHYESLMTEEYYYEVTTVNIKENSRIFLKIIILYWSCQIFQNTFFLPSASISLLLELLNLIFTLICYLIYVNFHTYYRIEQVNIVVLLVFFVSCLLELNDNMGLYETGFTPFLQIGLLMFSIMRVNLYNALIIWVCSFSILVLGICTTIEEKKYNHDNMITGCNYYTRKCLKQLPLYETGTSFGRLSLSFLILGCNLTCCYVYLYFVSNFHKRYSFKKLGHDIQAKLQLKAAMKIQLRWLDTIMPKMIKDEYLEHSDAIKADKWVFIKTFDNVSILFADIVGFTKLSSNKTASNVVALLNDLFNRFDELCAFTNCEKLGTLGDCYYCMAGCPNSRPDHAVSCIEMGLGMCRIIKKFNKDYGESVEMRVGIHTGRVNAAIIGKKRFRFDVYSNDVIIANTLESSGKPGRVHISETVYHFIRNTYAVEPSEDLEIKREQGHGLAGMVLNTILIKTYFIDPLSSHMQISDTKFQGNQNLKLITLTGKAIPYKNDMRRDTVSEVSESESIRDTMMKNKICKYRRFIEDLRFDPSQRIRQLTNPPLYPYSLRFREKEIEWHFNIASLNWIDLEVLSWQELGPLIDTLACSMYSFFIYISLLILFPSISRSAKMAVFGNNLLSFVMILVAISYCLNFKAYLRSRQENIIYVMVSHPIIRSLTCLYFLSSPLITIICILNDCTKIYTDTYFTIGYFLLILFSLFVIPLFLSAHYFVKTIISILNISVSIFIFTTQPCIRRNFKYTFPQYSCFGQTNTTDVSFNKTVKMNFIFQMIMTFVVMILVIREIEINMRLLFYIMRENRINYEEASRAMTNAQELLYNIIPKYVFNQLKVQPGNEIEITNFNYAMSVPKAAVIFACISNFFSKYYREDYKSGENALKLLHKIICYFDDLLKKDMYKNVDKIKTINDCYMVASGLNLKLTDESNLTNGHLSSLMYYAFDMMNALKSFNENFIIGSDKFEIKIGYNFGPVTAGIIGSTKPMYDIWGDTVNVSSRMYSTGSPGKIQVPDYVSHELQDEFSFKYRGKIFIKGKGEMNTYICKGPKVHEEKAVSHSPIVGRKSILNTAFLKSLYKRKKDSSIDKPPDETVEKKERRHKHKRQKSPHKSSEESGEKKNHKRHKRNREKKNEQENIDIDID